MWCKIVKMTSSGYLEILKLKRTKLLKVNNLFESGDGKFKWELIWRSLCLNLGRRRSGHCPPKRTARAAIRRASHGSRSSGPRLRPAAVLGPGHRQRRRPARQVANALDGRLLAFEKRPARLSWLVPAPPPPSGVLSLFGNRPPLPPPRQRLEASGSLSVSPRASVPRRSGCQWRPLSRRLTAQPTRSLSSSFLGLCLQKESCKA